MAEGAWIFDQLGGPEVLRWKETDSLTPGPGEVLLEIETVGLNRSDLLFMAGRYITQPPSPSHLGQEAVGKVVALGPDSESSFEVGARVGLLAGRLDYAAMGTYRTHGVYSTRALLPIPESLSSTKAAGLWLAGLTAWGGLNAGGIDRTAAGKVVVTAASSGVGLLALQIAKAKGAQTIAVTTSQGKRDALAEIADHVVVQKEHEPTLAAIHEVTPDGASLLFDPVGFANAKLLYEAAGTGAHIVYYGIMAGTEAPLDLVSLLRKDLGVHGFTIYRLLRDPQLLQSAVEELQSFAADGRVDPLVDRTFPLSEAPKALTAMAENQHIGKLVLEVS